MLSLIDSFLNKITMYRLVLYYLIILIAVAAIFGTFGILPYSPVAIIFSTLFLLLIGWITNNLFAKVFNAQPNVESVYITALILALIITPAMPTATTAVSFLAWAIVWAIASKYILAIDKKHIFNPAAFAVTLTAFTINQYASWWIGGNLPMMAFVIVGGLLVMRKIQRFDLVFSFFIAAFASIVFMNGSPDVLATIQKATLHTPIFFFAFIMLTEPLTTPPMRWLRIVYGAFVGILFAPQIHVGSLYSTPELALIVGNVFAYAVSPKKKYALKVVEKKEISKGIYDFVFSTEKAIPFRPGQYMEWTLAHKGPDTRGNRRYFTIASSPTEKDIRLGVRFYDNSSSFKKAMLALAPGDALVAGQLAGDFVLPKDPKVKLAFIAGGIGITPFRSMIKYFSDRGEKRDVVLLYSNRTKDEVAYREVFDEAEKKIGLRTAYVLTGENEKGVRGRIDAALIAQDIPDYKERMFYISGTHAMTMAFKKTLRDMGIPQNHIKIDFFPGFA